MQKSSLTLLHVLRRGDLSPSRNERSGLKLDRAMVANVVKLNFATRRRDGFKFKGGSYLVGSDRVKFVNLTSNLNAKNQGEVSRDDFSSFEAKLSVR